MNATIATRPNADLLEEKYACWKEDVRSVEPTWAAFFEGFELGLEQLKRRDSAAAGAGASKAVGGGGEAEAATELALGFRAKVVSLVYHYRTVGHTKAWLDPLSDGPPQDSSLEREMPEFSEEELEREIETQFYRGGERMKLRRLVELMEETYCGKIGFEFMHLHTAEVRNWLRERIEARVGAPREPVERKKKVLGALVEAESFEQFLHRKFVGQKRFSLEGGESLMVALNAIFEKCPEMGVAEIVMGMAHRGRLNVLANFLRKPLQVLFYEFNENYVPDLVAGDGDVKYHLGFRTRRVTENGEEVNIRLAANPSHLEAVNAVVEGMARGRQRYRENHVERSEVLPVLLHGDAAFAGQGTVAEVLNLSQLQGYRTGGTIHIVTNNQIGFTTTPEDARSSHYCTDVAKMVEAPVIHVNGDHPMEVLYAAELAIEYRQRFKSDVVIDIVCYRRHGHNEGDEPAFTQPVAQRKIMGHDTVAKLYRQDLITRGVLTQEEADEIDREFGERLEEEHAELERLHESGGGETAAFFGASAVVQPAFSFDVVETGVEESRLRELGVKLAEVPEAFKVNRKVKRTVLDKRREAAEGTGAFNWANAEALAFATLLTEGHPVRLSGQDVRRGTFSQRHAVLYGTTQRDRYIPLDHLAEGQAPFRAYNSLLSEAAVLGFDYGYSQVVPEQLTMWEAQFGDFANGAQVIIDQFICSAESKWGTPSNLVLLLPHGYEGQGPEHSSARLERFLQLCAENNIQVCNVTKPAQYFHLLRRQVKRETLKPLVLMTPKSLLRHKEAVSTLADMAAGTSFQEVLDDEKPPENPRRVTRLIFCTGKVYYDLVAYREEHGISNSAIIRIEQIYPLNWELLEEIVARYPKGHKKWVWCQEEPLNMGAWTFIGPRLQQLNKGARVRYAGRDRAASTAGGSKAIHLREQAALVANAFSV